MIDDQGPWFRDGLAFECTRCGDCCAGFPGYVWVDEAEIARLADHLGMSPEAFGRRYLRAVEDRLSLVETRGHDCVFWDRSRGCTVYEARPDQCRTWPFWEGNVATPEAWDAALAKCPGAGRGRVHTADEILASLGRSS